MKLTEFLLDQMNREVERSRKVLQQVPGGKYDWKPHDRSMAFGYLADMVATIPTWVAMAITRDELDIAPTSGPSARPERKETSEALVQALEKAAEQARSALQGTTDEYLTTRWQLKAGGQVVWEAPRHEVIQDTISHWSHHRGQMTVYLRLMGAKVPAVFGPSADETSFA